MSIKLTTCQTRHVPGTCTQLRINRLSPLHTVTILTTCQHRTVPGTLYRVHCTPPRINRWIPFRTIITTCRTDHVTGYTVPNCESITGHHSIPYSPHAKPDMYRVHCTELWINHWSPFHTILTTCQRRTVLGTLYPPRINRWIPIPHNPEMYPHRKSVTEKLSHTSTLSCTGYTVPNNESIVNTYQYYTSTQTCTGYIVPQLWINYWTFSKWSTNVV